MVPVCTPSDDDNLEISGYILLCSDNPSNNTRGGVCVNYKKFFPLTLCNIYLSYEFINFELKISHKLCCFVALIDLPHQTEDDFLAISQNFKFTLDKLSRNNFCLLVAIDNFIAKLKHCYSQETKTLEEISDENITFQF